MRWKNEKQKLPPILEVHLSGNATPKKQETFIFVSHDGDIESSDSELEEIREWHIRKLLKLKAVFQPEIKQVSKTLG